MLKRNDKCYCGSGKKYKNCCMEKDKLGKVQQMNNDALDKKKARIDKKYTESIVKLSAYLEELILNNESFAKYEEEARKAFFDEKSETTMVANRFFASYFSYDYLIGREMTPALYVLNKKKFSNAEKKVIYNCVNSYPSLFEIDSISGREVVIKDAFSGRKFSTLDSKILGEFNKGDYIIARPVLIEDTYILIDLTIRIQNETKDVIYNSIMEAYEANKTSNMSIEYFVYMNTLFFYKYMVQLLQMSNYAEEVEGAEENNDTEDIEAEELVEKAAKISEENIEEVKESENTEEASEETDEVAKLVQANIEDKSILEGALNVWKTVASKTEITGSENGWAAGLEYHYRKSLGETVTQNEVAKNYGVSSSTLAKRNKEITAIVLGQ